MLTGLAFLAGMCLVMAAGGAIVDLPFVRKRLDRMSSDLPMMWDWSNLRKH